MATKLVNLLAIDGVWVSAAILVTFASFCPFPLSPGDHHAAIIDLNLSFWQPSLSIVHLNVHH